MECTGQAIATMWQEANFEHVVIELLMFLSRLALKVTPRSHECEYVSPRNGEILKIAKVNSEGVANGLCFLELY